MAQKLKTGSASGAVDRLKSEASGLVGALGDRAVTSVLDRVEGTAGRLSDYTHGAGPGLAAALTGAKGLAEGKTPAKALLGAGMTAVKEKVKAVFGGGGKGKKQKVTNIIESIDVGVPIKVAYNQWTQFTDFPSFMKKVESVEQADDEKLNWKAQVLWSHRTWEATILEQVPDDKIVWRSKGDKGYVDGAVTFHELAPNLTRILVVLEYHPQGLFEHTGNIWRAQGRRVRLELKHFRRQIMSDALLHPEEIEGWRGRIEDGQVVESDQARSSAGRRRAGATQTRRRSTTQNQSGSASSRRPAADKDRPSRGQQAATRQRGAGSQQPAPSASTQRRRRQTATKGS